MDENSAKLLEETVENMINSGLLEETISCWNSPALLLKKRRDTTPYNELQTTCEQSPYGTELAYRSNPNNPFRHWSRYQRPSYHS